MMASWAYNVDGSLRAIAYSGVKGAAFVSYQVDYGANGSPVSATYSNRMGAAWTYGAARSYLVAYADVASPVYASFTDIVASGGPLLAQARDIRDGSGGTLLKGGFLTLTAATATFRIDAGGTDWSLTAHASETIAATGATNETFALRDGFGLVSIRGFDVTSDQVEFQAGAFASVADLLLHASAAGHNLRIDAGADTLTLANVLASGQSASAFFNANHAEFGL